MTTLHRTTTSRRRIVAALAVLGLSTLTAACSSGGDTATLPSVTGGGTAKLTIAVPFDEPGIGLKNGDTYSGFDIETAKYVAASLGVTPENITWKEAISNDRESLLESGGADLVVATYSITDERKKVVDFAGPYFEAHQDLLVRRNSLDAGPGSITGPETLDGANLCSVTGTTSAQYVKEHYAGKIQLQEYGKFSECVDALAKGDIDAVSTDDVILAGFAAQPQYKGLLAVVGKGFTNESYGIGIKKGDTDMVTKVNAALKTYVSSGAWAKNLAATVGPSGYKAPAEPTPGTA